MIGEKRIEKKRKKVGKRCTERGGGGEEEREANESQLTKLQGNLMRMFASNSPLIS